MANNSENAWMEDKVTAKFINLLKTGDDIYIGCQGVAYQIKDGATVTVPRLVIEAAKDATLTRYKVDGNISNGKTQTKFNQPRFMVIPIDAPVEKTKEEKKNLKVIASIKGNDEDDE